MIIHVDGSTKNKPFVYRISCFRTRCCCGLPAAVFLRGLLLVSCVIAAMGQDCEGRDFRCVDPTHYAVCLPRELRSPGWAADPEVPCPEGTFCDERSPARCSPQPQSSFTSIMRRVARSLDHSTVWSANASGDCPGAGRFPLAGSCASLLECVPSLEGLRVRRAFCPHGAAFDRVSRRCVPRRLLPRDPRNAECLPEDGQEVAGRRKRSAEQLGPAELSRAALQKRAPQPVLHRAAYAPAAAIYVAANVTEISPAGPYGRCGEGETWDASLGQCMLTDERSIGPAFHCDGRGVFPDKGNVNAYISCDPLVTGEGFVAHRYWCPISMHFDPSSRVCRTYNNKRQRNSEKLRRRISLARPEVNIISVNDEARNPSDAAAEGEWSQEEEAEERVRIQRDLYQPHSFENSEIENESLNDVSDNRQIERSDTKQITDAVRNPKEVLGSRQEQGASKVSVDDWTKMESPAETNIDPGNAKHILKRGDNYMVENHQLVPNVDSKGSNEEDSIATEVRSADSVQNRNTFNQGYMSVNNEEQGFQGDSEKANTAFQIRNEAQQSGLKGVADSVIADEIPAAETDSGPTGAKKVLRRDELDQDHKLISSEYTGECNDADSMTGGQKLSETVQNNNVEYVDMNNNELALKRDSDQDGVSFQSQNAGQSRRQITNLGESRIADLNNQLSPLKSDSSPVAGLDVFKRDEVDRNQLDSEAYSNEGGEGDGLHGNVGVEDIERVENDDFGPVSVGSRDLQSHDQMKRGEEKSIADLSNEVSAAAGSTGEKKTLKREELKHDHQRDSGSDLGEDNVRDELQGYANVNNNGQDTGSDSEQFSIASQNENEAHSSNEMKRIAKSSSIGWPNKISGLIKDDPSIDEKGLLKRDEAKRSHGMFSRADTSGDEPLVGELSDIADADEGTVYNQLQESLPRYHRSGRRDDDAEISVASDTVKGDAQDSWRMEDVAGISDTYDARGSGGDSRRSLPLSADELALSDDRRSVDDNSQNDGERTNNDIATSAKELRQYGEGDNTSKESSNEHSKFVEREASSSNVHEAFSSDVKKNTGASHEPHDKFSEEQDEILRQLSSMKQPSAVSRIHNSVETSKERQERYKMPQSKQSRSEGNQHIILLKPHEDDFPVRERANEQANNPNSGGPVVSSSLSVTARSPKQLTSDKGQAEKEPTVLHDGHSKEKQSARKDKLTVARRQHSEKEIKGHSKREKNYKSIQTGVEKRESQLSSRTIENSDADKLKQKEAPNSDKDVRSGHQKGEFLMDIDKIIKDAERYARIKAAPRRPAIEYLEKQKRHAGGKVASQTSVSDPKRAGKNEGKEGNGKRSREAAGTKLISTLNPAPRVAGSSSAKADKRGDIKVSGKISRDVMEKKPTNNLNAEPMSASNGFETDDKSQQNQAEAKASYDNDGKNPVSSLTPAIQEIISNSVNKYSKFPPVSVQENPKPESSSAIKDRGIQQSVRRTNGFEGDQNMSFQGNGGPAHDTSKAEKKGVNRDTKEHGRHRATSTKESGFYQSGYISIAPMNKLARFQRNGRNVIYDVTSLTDHKISKEGENDSPYALSSRRRAVYEDVAVPEDDIQRITSLSTKRRNSKSDGKYVPSVSEKGIADRKERKENKGQMDNQVKEATHESQHAAPTKTDAAVHLRSLASFDDKRNNNAEGPLENEERSEKEASKLTNSDEEPSRLVHEANYERMPESAPGDGVTRPARRTGDVIGGKDTPLLNAMGKTIDSSPIKEREESSDTSFQCPGGGSYPYRSDDREYYSCVPASDGSGFVATLLSCAGNQVFDPITRSCTSRDIMPSPDSKSSQLPQSAPVVARSPAEEPLENPCSAEGRISNPYDCSAFYLCLPKRSAAGAARDFFHIALHCPKGSIFDSESRQCVEGSPTTCIPEYKLLDKLRRRRGRLRPQARFRASRSPEERCPRPGRFARAGGGCADYVLCARPGGVGPLLAVPVRCPPGLAFSAERARCVTPDVAGCQPDP